MANRQRTYQWVNGVIKSVDTATGEIRDVEFKPEQKKPPSIGIQTGLLVFTMSSVLMVFAGLGLFAFCFVLYSMIFG